MKVKSAFKSLDYSESLVEYTSEKFSKLGKFEMKPESVHVTFGASRHLKTVELVIQHSNSLIKAKASADDFYEAVDKAAHKLRSQLYKRKHKVQGHKRFDHSKGGKLLRLNPYLEMDYQSTYKKAG